MSFTLSLQPKQDDWLTLVDTGRYSRLGEGGSRGGGKSKTLRDVQIFRRFKYPNTIGWLFRRTHEELKDNHIDPMFRDYPALTEYWNAADRALDLPNGSTLGFKFAENYADILKFRGKQSMDTSVDESNLMREEEMVELSMCTRWPGYPDWQCKLMESFNPGGIGHNRINRLFINRNFKSNERPEMYHFTPIYAWDNVAWSENALGELGLSAVDYYRWTDEQRFEFFVTHTQYGRELNALPEPTRSQQLLGRFDSFEGQVFGGMDDAVHNLDNWLRDDKDWADFLHRCARYTGALDHATTGTRAYVLTSLDSGNGRYALDECYMRNVLITEMCAEVARLKSKYPKVDIDYIDPSTESDTQENDYELASIQDQYRRHGLSTVVPLRTKIGVGLDYMNQRLRVDPDRRHPFTGEMGAPALMVSRSRCPNLWREMQELQCIVRDGKIKYVGADHATDCLRYIEVAYMRPPVDKSAPVDRSTLHNTGAQFANRVHSNWAKQFDKKTKPAKTYW